MVTDEPATIPIYIHPRTLLDYSQVRALTGKSERSVRNDARNGRFPQPVRNGPKFTRFVAEDVFAWAADPEAWIRARKEGPLAVEVCKHAPAA